MDFMPILMNGQKLAEPTIKKKTGGEKKAPYTYEEVKERIINDMNNLSEEIDNNTEFYLKNEIVISIRMAENFIAKSYIPDVFDTKESMEFVGARIYDRNIPGKPDVKSKLYFVKCARENLDSFINHLNTDNFNEGQKKQLVKIQSVDILKPEEKSLGFEEEKDIYEVEIVLHPLGKGKQNALDKLAKYLDSEAMIKQYEDGPIFILSKIKKENLMNISKYNFLRTVHPMREINLPELRSSEGLKLPNVSNVKKRDLKVKIGVFDGGANEENEYLKPFLKNYDIASLPEREDMLKHGNAVCGAVLYGEINKYKTEDKLPEPICNVESFRVLPEKNIYKIIDNIEEIVNIRKDIDIYNISFGPRGPILDDQLNRFTYALDRLALQNKVFCIAVGNDGKVIEPYNRIQAPSDAVNCIGVGAYSEFRGNLYRADYSCVGEGREGGKIKPDLLAFGGDERNLFQAISLDGKNRLLTCGTSFSSPIVANRIGELTSISGEINPFIARTLVIHSADKKIAISEEEGFGIVKNNVKEIIQCNQNKVTVVYEGAINPKKSIKLPIPLPDISSQSGTAKFTWTLSTLTDVSALDSDLYTNTSIEETFHPNSNVFSFTKRGEKNYSLNIEKEKEKIIELLKKGYKQSKNPKSETGKKTSELRRRKLEYKWDTIIRKNINKNISSIKDPFLIISALSRDKEDNKKVKYVVALTVEMKKYRGNLYSDICNKYKVLTPLELRQEINSKIDIEI